jgi:hypothetical protein
MALSQMRVRFAIIALAVTLPLAGGPYAGTAHACTCAGGTDASAAYNGADAVFAGEMIRGGLEDLDPADGTMMGGVEFRVIDAWKGVSEEYVVLYGQEMVYYGEIEEGEMVTSNSCAYIFEKDGRYLVYSDRYEDGFRTFICDGTKNLGDARVDFQALGPPAAVLPETGGVSPEAAGQRTVLTLVAVAAALASLAAGAVFAGRIARRARR